MERRASIVETLARWKLSPLAAIGTTPVARGIKAKPAVASTRKRGDVRTPKAPTMTLAIATRLKRDSINPTVAKRAPASTKPAGLLAFARERKPKRRTPMAKAIRGRSQKASVQSGPATSKWLKREALKKIAAQQGQSQATTFGDLLASKLKKTKDEGEEDSE